VTSTNTPITSDNPLAAFCAVLMSALTEGQAVRHAREGIGVSQTVLANEAGISEPDLSLWESGDLGIPEETALCVWAALTKLDQEYRQHSILVRLEGDNSVITETNIL
jgi:transcriptional regulator with XRE-family HTH domain